MRILGIVVLCAGMPTMASAECKHAPIPWEFGRSISSTWRITGGSTCGSNNYHPENIARIEIETRPKNGVAGKSGPFGVAYKPNPGFKGSDTFSYAIIPNAHYRGFLGSVGRVTVNVISE